MIPAVAKDSSQPLKAPMVILLSSSVFMDVVSLDPAPGVQSAHFVLTLSEPVSELPDSPFPLLVAPHPDRAKAPTIRVEAAAMALRRTILVLIVTPSCSRTFMFYMGLSRPCCVQLSFALSWRAVPGRAGCDWPVRW